MAEYSLEGKRLGKYRLIRLLGRGGMGDVYLAEHEMLQSKVAVKVLPADLARDEEMRTRFLREARSAASLRHPHIIRIHDVDQQDGINFFSMDYVEGRALTEVIAASNGGMEEAEIIRISRQVLSALAEAHAAGIVHRDIKPDNVLIDQRGDVVVMDFGIAKAASSPRLTALGSFVGTVHYASPEQARGLEVEARSDLYSWGVVMYEMATGRTPFGGQDTAAVFYQHVHEPPPSLREAAPQISPELADFILKLLAKEPQDRFDSAQDALQTLERLGSRSSRHGSRSGRHRSRTRAPSPAARAQALVKEAQGLADKGGWSAALALAEKAFSLDPQCQEAKEVLERARAEVERDERIAQLTAEAEACLADGFFDEAVDVIIELAAISRDKDAVLAWLEEVQQKAEEARELEKSLQRGKALEAAGELDQARELYLRLCDQHPDYQPAARALERLELMRRAEKQAGQDHLDRARELLQKALDLDPDDTKARARLVEIEKALAREQQEQEPPADEAAPAPPDSATRVAAPATPPAQATRVAAAPTPPPPPPPPPSEQPVPPADSGDTRAGGSAPSPPSPPPPPPPEPPKETASPPEPAPQAQPPAKKSSGLWIAVVAVLVVAVGVAAWLGLSRSPQEKPPVKPPAVTAPTAKPPAAPQQPEAPKPRPVKPAQPAKPAKPEVAKPQAPETTTAQAPAAGTKPQTKGSSAQAPAAGTGKPQEQPAATPKKPAAATPEAAGSGAKTQALATAAKPEAPAVTPAAPKATSQQERALAGARRWIEVGQKALAAGELDRAQAAFESALGLVPDFAPAKDGLAQVGQARRARMQQEADRLVAEGQTHLQNGRLEQAEAAFKQALQKVPALPAALKGLERVGARRAELARQKEEERRRAEVAARARKLLDQGRQLLAQGQLDGAEAAFQAALALDAGLVPAKEGLAQVARRRQEKARAQAEAQRKARVKELLAQGQKALAGGDLNQAQARFQKALELDPNSREARQGLEQVKTRRAQLAEKRRAEQKRQQEMQEKRRRARLAFTQGTDYFNAGRYDKAVQAFQKYLEVFPQDQAGRKHLALAQRMLAESKVGTLVVGCIPVAEVYLDGRLAGKTPLVLKKVPVGSRRVEVRGYGGRQSRMVVIKGRSTVKVRFRLYGGSLAANSVPWSKVYLDGQELGTTPLKIDGLPLGIHRLEMRRQGFKTFSKDVTLYKGKVVRIKARLHH